MTIARLRAALAALVLVTTLAGTIGMRPPTATAQVTGITIEFGSCVANTAVEGCTALGNNVLQSPTAVVVSPDGDSAWVASPDTDRVVWFTRSPGGDLTEAGCVSNAGDGGCIGVPGMPMKRPRALAVSPDGDSVWVAAENAVMQFFAGPDGSLAYGGCVDNIGAAGCADLPENSLVGASALAVSPDGDSVWVTGELSDTVVHFHAAPHGQLTFGGCVASLPRPGCADIPASPMRRPTALAFSPDGDSLWVGSKSTRSVAQFFVAPEGQLTYGGCVAGDAEQGCADLPGTTLEPWALAVTPDGTSLYVASFGLDTVVHLTAAPEGQLTYGGCVASGPTSTCDDLPDEPMQGPSSLLVSPDGDTLYVAAYSSDAVAQFSISPGGQLTFDGCIANTTSSGCANLPESPLDGPFHLAASSDGTSLYAPTLVAQSVVHLRRAGPVPPAGTGRESQFVPLTPARVFDTRPGTEGPGPKGIVPAGGVIDVQVNGVAGVPASGVSAVVMNVTATESRGPGFVTVWPTGSPRPLASSLNLTAAGQTRPNLVTVPVGTDGTISIFSRSGTHLLGDIAGYYTAVVGPVASGRLTPITPHRVFDTRPGTPVDGPKGFVRAGHSIDVQIVGVEGVPHSGVSAVVMNVTATEAADAGYVTVWPTGEPRPLASNLNLNGPGDTTPNLVIVPVGAGGKVSLYSRSGAHLLADVTGYFSDASTTPSMRGLFVPLAPTRVFDTRPGVAGAGPNGAIPAGGTISTKVAGTSGIPTDASAVVLNVTATETGAAGFVTTWPTGTPLPNASTLNVTAGDTRPNAAILPLGAGGRLDHYSRSTTHLLADTTGYFTARPPAL
jgi:sugar lactone lactonase YvrE